MREDSVTFVWSIGPVSMTLTQTLLANEWCHWMFGFEFTNLGRIAATSTDGVTYHAYVRHMLESVEADLHEPTQDHDLHNRVAKYMTEFPFLPKEVTA